MPPRPDPATQIPPPGTAPLMRPTLLWGVEGRNPWAVAALAARSDVRRQVPSPTASATTASAEASHHVPRSPPARWAIEFTQGALPMLLIMPEFYAGPFEFAFGLAAASSALFERIESAFAALQF